MSTPTSSELWPSLDSMKQYLETWSRNVYELEAKVRTLEAMSVRMEATYTEEIARLSNELANCAAPRDQRIAELEASVKGLEQYVQDLIAERQRAIERLAKVLEVTVTGSMTLQDLIGQTMTLVDHTKKMFRERL
jgi:uncharacterized protein YoxC